MDKTTCFNPRPPRRAGATQGKSYSVPVWHVSILAHPEGRALLPLSHFLRPKQGFQSSPTPKGGRYVGYFDATEATAGFNPRPPRRAGATIRAGDDLERERVSILAHPEGRALLHSHSKHSAMLKFQSSPTPKGGRYINARRGKCLTCLFQSSPTPKGGRYGLHRPARYLLASFNPRPPRRAGATRGNYGLTQYLNVSILAHPEGRALLIYRLGRISHERVSILAHPEGRALPVPNVLDVYAIQFQSSPTPKGGRYPAGRGYRWAIDEFQSSPTPKGGRYGATIDETFTYSGFNPRPPRRAGATWHSWRQ